MRWGVEEGQKAAQGRASRAPVRAPLRKTRCTTVPKWGQAWVAGALPTALGGKGNKTRQVPVLGLDADLSFV